jgi:manganese/zinc/iron transport system ATP- binding protein
MNDTGRNTGCGEIVVRCKNLTVAYGEDVVLRDVSFNVERGVFLPFVGPNGAGKTTLLRTILGFIRPRSGRVATSFGGIPPGYVPQYKAIDSLYPVSVRDIVVMGLYPGLGWWRRPDESQRAVVTATLKRFGLAEHQSRTFAELSGGMKQKTMLARAFVTGAEVLIMDEPALELDEQSSKEVLEHLFRLSRDEGKTVLMAHHGLEQIAGFTEKVCLVDYGRVRMTRMDELRGEGVLKPHDEGGRGHVR